MKRKKKKKEFNNSSFQLYDHIIRNNTKDNKKEKYKVDLILSTNYANLKKTLSMENILTFKFLLKKNKIENKYEKYFFVKHFCKFVQIMNLLNKKIESYFSFNNDLKINLFIGLIKDDNCRPFWNKKIENKSKDIFLPTEENLKKNKNPNTFKQKTWFETEHFIVKNKKAKFSKIEVDKERKEFLGIKAKKIKLFFTTKQKKYFKKLIGIYRYFYNRAIQYINNYDKKTEKTSYLINFGDNKSKKEINLKDVKSKFDFKTMRKYLKDNYPEWSNKVVIQSHFVDQAFKEASDNYNKCMEKYKKNNKPFELKFKTKKNKKQSVNIEKVMLNKNTNTLFAGIKENKKSIFGNIKMREKISNFDTCDSSISHNVKLNEYYLNLNYHDNTEKDKEILKNFFKKFINNLIYKLIYK